MANARLYTNPDAHPDAQQIGQDTKGNMFSDFCRHWTVRHLFERRQWHALKQ